MMMRIIFIESVKNRVVTTFFGLITLFSCVKDRNFDQITDLCTNTTIAANRTYAEVKSMYVDETIQIQEDIIIEGYVISSDSANNFFGVLHFQDKPSNPTDGFQIEIDLRDSHLFYPVGSKIYIKLKGLYLGISKDVYKLGGVFSSFGNLSVGRLPAPVVSNHIVVSCDEKVAITPQEILITDLEETTANTLVTFNSVEIFEEELGLSYALAGEETERTIIDCNDNKIVLLNSGYADFQEEILSEKKGSITGILFREKDSYQLVVRDLNDINFTEERCEDFVDEFSSTQIFISELADPDNNAKARFVELYNASTESLSLKGWTLRRYTNDGTEISSTIDLSDYTIAAESTLVISPNATEFEIAYGFTPDIGVSTNSPADSNGDDNLELVDPFGTIIDVFGVIGEDGLGTNHEFEDGRAVRNLDVVLANPVYTFDEWTIYNDTGKSGTTKQPQIAPNDFSPGNR